MSYVDYIEKEKLKLLKVNFDGSNIEHFSHLPDIFSGNEKKAYCMIALT